VATGVGRGFGNSPDFWLDLQRRSGLRDALDSPRVNANGSTPPGR
jgi:plasmid maintenance system antidote protein VapI